jgi:hypothetical protein
MYFDVQTEVDLSDLPLLLKRVNLESAPLSLQRSAEGMFERRLEKSLTIRQVLASLVYDSFAQPALSGARGGAAISRQMVLRAEGYDIHLKIWGVAPQRRMAGQVLARMVPEGFLSLQVDLPHLTVVGTISPNEAA